MSSSPNPYAPPETSAQIYNDETWLQGELLSNIAYGVQLTLFLQCAGLLIMQMHAYNRRRNAFLLAYICVIFAVGTIFMGAQSKFTQIAFVEDSRFPGGPGQFEDVNFSMTSNEISAICFIIGNWLMDAFLVWRCVVVYRACGTAWVSALAAMPCLMLCASIALGTTQIVQTAASSPFQDVRIVLAYYVMSLALNILVTLLIVGRLLYYRRWVVRTLGAGHVSCYVNVSAMLVESASLYSLFAVLFLVPFGMGSDLGNVFLQTVSQVQTVSSLLIIFRVALGKAWSDDTTEETITHSVCAGDTVRLDTMRFMPHGSAALASDAFVESKEAGDTPGGETRAAACDSSSSV